MVIDFITDFLLWFILLTIIWIIIHLSFKNNEGFQDIGKWNFKEISGTQLNQLSVSSDSRYIWGIDTNNKIVFRNGVSGNWKHISGSLKQISVSNNGNHVWGVNNNDNIYYRPGYIGSWKNISGKLSYIVVSGNANHIWGFNHKNLVYYRQGLHGTWKPISNTLLKYITVSNNGEHVYGIGMDSLLYKLSSEKKFKRIHGSTKKWKSIAISGNGKILVGIQSHTDSNKNNMYYTNINDTNINDTKIQPNIIKGDCLVKVKQSDKNNIPIDKWFPDDKYGGPNKPITIKECIERNYDTFCQDPTYKIETNHGDIIKLINPKESDRTYSSIYNNDSIGTRHARSMLNSKQAWSAKNSRDGEWMQIDLGKKQHIFGIVTQGREQFNQYITNFSIQYSLDNKNFTKIPTPFTTNNKLDIHYLNKIIIARYIRIIIHQWKNHISLRAGIIIKNKPNTIQLEWKPLGTDRVQPIGTDRVQPIGTDRVQPIGTDRVQPIGTKAFKQLSLSQEANTIWAIDNDGQVFYIEKYNILEEEEGEGDYVGEEQDGQNYIRLEGDCAGNNISTHLNTNIEECQQKCNAKSKCLGFSYLNNTCITKSKDCPLPPYKYKNQKYTTNDNSNNIWGKVDPRKNSSDNKVQYLGTFKSAKQCQEHLATRDDITSYTWYNNKMGDYAKQCYGRTDGIWDPKTQKNITSAQKKKKNKKTDPDKWTFYKKNIDSKNIHCNWKCYLDRYPDLSTAIGTNNIQGAKDHYINFGKKEGRDCTCTNGTDNTEDISPCIGKSHTNCLQEKNTCNWDVSNEKCYPIDCTDRREADCEKTNNCEWDFAQNSCKTKCGTNPPTNNLCGCDTIAIARRNFKDSDSEWSKNYLALTKPFPNDTYHCIINPNTGQSLEISDHDKCEVNPKCKFIKGDNGINMCIQIEKTNTCEEEEQQDNSWIKNYCVKPPYQLLGQTENKHDCEALCKANHVDACSYQCNGCYGGPDIQPSLNNNLNCFQYAKHINHSNPLSETPIHTIIPQNNPIAINDTNSHSDSTIHNSETNRGEEENIPNSETGRGKEDDIPKKNSRSGCTSFIGYQQNGLLMTT